MSDYVYGPPSQMTFGTRDTLAPNNADKVVKGSQLDVEFTGIAAAVNSKLNLNNPVFTGTMGGGVIDGGAY
jgi:hypothetical protein